MRLELQWKLEKTQLLIILGVERTTDLPFNEFEVSQFPGWVRSLSRP